MIYLVTTQQTIFTSVEFKKIFVSESFDIIEQFDWIAVDTETTGLDCHNDKILLLQLGDEENQIVVDCTTVDINIYKGILETKDLILQNAKFDLKFLYERHIIPKGTIWDTMLAERVLFNGLDPVSNLAHLAKKYCSVTLPKDIRSNIAKLGLTTAVIQYSANDVKYLHDIKRKQEELADKFNLGKAIKLENSFVKCLAYTELCGIFLNRDKWITKYTEAGSKLKECVETLDAFVVGSNFTKYIDHQLDLFSTKTKTTINWASPKQVIPLFKDIGINVYTPDNKSGESINEKILIKQKDRSPVIPLYLEYKSIQKDFSTYGPSFLDNINKATGRIHSDFNQLMITSRLSSTNPNLQNLPSDKRTRSCFTNSNEDTILVVADYDGQEDKVFVNRSKESKMIEFYNGEFADGHSYVAKLCFPRELNHIELKDVKKERPDLRFKAKSAKFAIHYSGTGYTIANNLNISEDEGNAVYDAYLTAFPDIGKYLKDQQRKAKSRGYIASSTVTGRKVWCKNFKELKRNGDNKALYKFAKLACNYPIQNESAEITKIAGIYFFNWVLQHNLFNTVLISNLVHDEIMIECPKDMCDIVADKLKECMEKAGDIYCKIIPLTATPEITEYWKH